MVQECERVDHGGSSRDFSEFSRQFCQIPPPASAGTWQLTKLRLRGVARGHRLPMQMHSLSYGDVYTAWDRPEPIKWPYTVLTVIAR